MRQSGFTPHLVHLTGLFSPLLWAANRLAKQVSAPLVLSPRGSLLGAALERKAWKKRFFLRVAQQPLRRVACFHATSTEELTLLHQTLGEVRGALIPNGVSLPQGIEETHRGAPAPSYLLFLGRLDSYKRVELILKAFARVKCCQDELWVAGEGDSAYKAMLESLAANLGLKKRVRFLGRIEGDMKKSVLAGASGVVLASHSENFGMAVAEALAHGTPCVVTKTAPWEGLERERCGYWVDDSEEALADGMRRLMALSPEERREMGARGRAWMARDFSWDRVATQMIELYKALIEEKRSSASSH